MPDLMFLFPVLGTLWLVFWVVCFAFNPFGWEFLKGDTKSLGTAAEPVPNDVVLDAGQEGTTAKTRIQMTKPRIRPQALETLRASEANDSHRQLAMGVVAQYWSLVQQKKVTIVEDILLGYTPANAVWQVLVFVSKDHVIEDELPLRRLASIELELYSRFVDIPLAFGVVNRHRLEMTSEKVFEAVMPQGTIMGSEPAR